MRPSPLTVALPVTQSRGFITHQFQHQEPAYVLRSFIKQYPACLATYLVMQGVYSYQEGNYWSHIIDEYEFGPNHAHLLGQFFRDFLHQHNLSSFASVEGHKFVSVILLHGGIPNYSLHDFFENTIKPRM